MDSARYQVWLDGGMVAPEDEKVSVLTATAMRGANVYEGLRAYWSEERENLFVWKLDQHLKRLFINMKIMRMTPYRFDEYRQAVLDWARANRFREDVHMRLVTCVGDGGAGTSRSTGPKRSRSARGWRGTPPPRRRPPERHPRVCQQLAAHPRRLDAGPREGRVQLPEQPSRRGGSARQRLRGRPDSEPGRQARRSPALSANMTETPAPDGISVGRGGENR